MKFKTWFLIILFLVVAIVAWMAMTRFVSKSFERDYENNTEEFSNLSVEDLIISLEDIESNEFYFAVMELKNRGTEASESAQALADALAVPRRDSIFAGEALVAMGESGYLATPILVENLHSERSEVRGYSSYALGAIGKKADCSIPSLANLLWDEDAYVRYTAMGAIEDINNLSLNNLGIFGLDYELPIVLIPDEPEGEYVSDARNWWLEEGQYQDWSSCADLISEN